jgi:hypothetical protein
MGKIKTCLLATLAMVLLVTVQGLQAQYRRGGADTPFSAELKGEGYFLKGAGWYERNAAVARRIDTGTMILWNNALKSAYDNMAHERYLRLQKMQNRRNEIEADYYRRLRENPDREDISSGAALNALLSDLIAASYEDSVAWRNAQVKLPEGISIPSLSFQFVDMAGSKNTSRLRDSLIYLSKLNVGGDWPVALRHTALEPEEKAYEQAIQAAFEKCKAGKLDIPTIEGMKRAIKVLKDKAATVVKAEGGYRTTAVAFLTSMEKAQGLFAAETADFAEELVGDAQQHEAQTVEELLGFMRKYSLRFAEAGDQNSPLYATVYALLRKQREALGLKGSGPAATGRVAADNPLREGSVWVGRLIYEDELARKVAAKQNEAPKKAVGKKGANKVALPKNDPNHVPYKLVVKTIDGNRFSGESFQSERFEKKVEGTVDKGQIRYSETYENGNTFRMEGVIRGNVITFSFSGKGHGGRNRSGEGELRSQ